VDQLSDNLASTEVDLPADAVARLDAVSAIELGFPYGIYTDEELSSAVTGGTVVRGWPA